MEQSEWCYEQELGKIYVKLDEFDHPFQNISVDPLGHMEVKAFSKSRKIMKVWLLLIRCVDTGTVLYLIMESMESKSVVNAHLRLQLKMGRIDRVSVDGGTNLIELKRSLEWAIEIQASCGSICRFSVLQLLQTSCPNC